MKHINLISFITALGMSLVLNACGSSSDGSNGPGGNPNDEFAPYFAPPTENTFTVTDTEDVNDGFAQRLVENGTVDVPEDHSKATERHLRLSVTRIRANDTAPTSSAVIYLEGGPGAAATATALEDYVAAGLVPESAADLDFIIVDQRGTGKSLPALDDAACDDPELDAAMLSLDQPVDTAATINAAKTAVQACKDALSAKNIDLNAFNTLQSADDIETLRQALGYDSLIINGSSYGTALAQAYVNKYSDKVSKVVLDGIVDVGSNWIVDTTNAFLEGLNALFTRCANDPFCSSEDYPDTDLEERFEATLSSLSATPLDLELLDSNSNDLDVSLDSHRFLDLIEKLLNTKVSARYGSLLINLVYDTVSATDPVDQGIAQLGLELFLSQFSAFFFEEDGSDASFSIAMHLAVTCAHNRFPQTGDFVDLPAALVDYLQFSLDVYEEMCAIMAVPEVSDASVTTAISTTNPVLLFSGVYDPATPASYGDTLAASLSDGTHALFTTYGHGVLSGANDEGQCAASIVQQFYNNQTPDLSCAADDQSVNPNLFALRPDKFEEPDNIDFEVDFSSYDEYVGVIGEIDAGSTGLRTTRVFAVPFDENTDITFDGIATSELVNTGTLKDATEEAVKLLVDDPAFTLGEETLGSSLLDDDTKEWFMYRYSGDDAFYQVAATQDANNTYFIMLSGPLSDASEFVSDLSALVGSASVQ